MTKCFLTHSINEAAVYLRRYVSHGTPGRECPGPMGYHDTMTYHGDFPIPVDSEGCWSNPYNLDVPHGDPRWPAKCEHCAYVFQEADQWQYFADRIHTDGTRRWPHRQLPVGAMYYADWYPPTMFWDNMEGEHLFVVTPGGEWNIDSRASNCTMPDDRLHRCWVRHGVPPDLHVDKAGRTCAAGAGSIQCGKYHGFLHHGNLT